MLDALWAGSHSPTGKARGTLPFGLLDEHIFLGLTPYTEKRRFNLFRSNTFRNLFASLKLRSAVQALTISLLLAVTLLSFLGSQAGGKSLGTSLFWYFMFPYLLLSYLVLGRVYCSVCPIAGLIKLSRRIGSKELPAPSVFNHIGIGAAAFFALGFLWFETLYGIREIPYRTAAFILSLLSTADGILILLFGISLLFTFGVG